MAEKIAKKEIKMPLDKKQKKAFFPKLTLVYGLFLIVFAVLQFFNVLNWPSLAMIIFIFVGGLLLIWLSLAIGFENKRTDILKRYI